MINYEYAELFQKDSVKKELILDFGDFQITNEKLYSESFELSESLCSQDELKFGCCEASEVKFKCRNEFGDLRGKWFTASLVLNGNTDNPFKIGRYKVYSSKPSGDRLYTDIVAYDAMYDILNADVSKWYESLKFPVFLKDMRNSFFEYLGITQKDATLIMDSFDFAKTILTNAIPGKDIITAICELNGVFGHINRNGEFEYISLPDRTSNAIYPSTTLYPSPSLYPYATKYGVDYENIVKKGKYRSCKFEDFETTYITEVQIRQESGDIGAVADYSDLEQDYLNVSNSYIVEDNFLAYGMNSGVLKEIAVELLKKIRKVRYRPFDCQLQGNPCIEVGDYIRIRTRIRNVDSYVLNRTIKGIQALSDAIETQGVYQYKEKVNALNREIKRLRGKTNILERTVEETKSLITDKETGLQSQITQNAEKIETKVTKGNVSSQISQEAELIDIEGNRIRIWSTNFKLDETGLVEILSAIITGTFESGTHGELVRIENGHIYTFGSSSESTAKIGPTEIGEYTEHFGIKINKNTSGGMMFVISGDDYASNDIAYRLPSQLYDNALPVHKFYGDLELYNGKKSRVASTESYNDRALYCYEMPSPMFGDIGHGIIGEDGLCYVDMELIFGETVDTVQNYQVFLQSYSEHNVYVYEKTQDYFVVKGQPNTEFDWEIKAKQLDFPFERLEEPAQELDYKETNYVASAEAYLSEYEQEVLNYE